MVYLSGAVEGIADEAVFRRIVAAQGADVHRIQVQRGKANLLRALPGYNTAAQRDPWLVIVDLDQDFDCAPGLVTACLPAPSVYMLRVAVHEIEAWLLADRDRFSSFFSVPASTVPEEPDPLPNPKAALLASVARSRRKAIRTDMLPRPGSGRIVGAAYTSRLIEFATDTKFGWRPTAAAERSPSLSSCLSRLDDLIAIAP